MNRVYKLSHGPLAFRCSGCRMLHAIPVEGRIAWGWNGKLDFPTFTPSILSEGTVRMTDEEVERVMRGEKVEPTPLRCHSYVTDGKIQYLNDCSHALAGQTIDLPIVNEEKDLFSFPEE